MDPSDSEAHTSPDQPTSAYVKALAALQAPLDFPSLRQAAIPGDCVVIALAPGVPEAPQVVAAVIAELAEAGVAEDDIIVLHSSSDTDAGAADPRSHLPEAIRDSVRLVVHAPREQEQMSYLAADDQGRPIYLNRWLTDADLVVPIGRFRLDDFQFSGNRDAGYWNETLFPTFADKQAQEEMAATGVELTAGQQAQRQRRIDRAGWLLGIQATIEVVPGKDESAGYVLFGTPEAVFREGKRLYRSLWHREVSQKVDLVIAGVSGTASQTWENVCRSLEAALRITEDGGAVAICSELVADVGPALKRLARGDDAEALARHLRKQRSADAPLARLLASVVDRITVYFLSGLSEEVVSQLGMAYVATPDEVARLAARRSSCVLLNDAQYAWPVVKDD